MRLSARALQRTSALPAALVVMLAVAGCADDPYAEQMGRLVIVQEPDGVEAPWRLEGEHGYVFEGRGDGIVHGLRSGTYTVVWMAPWGWAAPPRQAVEVTTAVTATVTGTYTTRGTVFPGSPDELLADFRLAYVWRDLDLYANLIDPGHVTILQPATVADYPELGTRLSVAEERRIHQRMFSGEDLVEPDGTPLPGVSSISFYSLTRQTEWDLSPPGDPIPGVLCATFGLDVDVRIGWERPPLWVRGPIRFYVTSRDTVVAGVHRPRYRLRGQVDLTEHASEQFGPICWGSLKARFR